MTFGVPCTLDERSRPLFNHHVLSYRVRILGIIQLAPWFRVQDAHRPGRHLAVQRVCKLLRL